MCKNGLRRVFFSIAKIEFMCYIPNYQIKEDKSMNTFFINSLRRRERRRKLL